MSINLLITRALFRMVVDNISQLLGIEDSSIYDLLEREDIETITVDHQKRVKRSVFEEWYSHQSHYRTQQDREADLELERQSMSLPEMARALGIDRNDSYTFFYAEMVYFSMIQKDWPCDFIF